MSKYNPISEERKREIKSNIIKELKAMIFPTVLLALFAFFIVFIMTYQNKTVEEDPVPLYAYDGDDKPIVMENENLRFEMDPLTTTFDITVKKSGKVWHSTAVGAENDASAITEEKNKLQSTMLLAFGNEAGGETVYDSFSLSTQNGIYSVEQGDGYVRVDYSIGKVAKEFIIPPVIPVARLDELLSQLDPMDKDFAKGFYKLYDINKLKKDDNKEELLANYPALENEPLYIQRPIEKDTQKKSLQKMFEAAGYTYDEYLEHKALNLKESVNDKPVFNVSVIYRLDGDDLVVEVPYSSIESPSAMPVTSVTPLPFFGAGDKQQEGFMLVPEGGGSIINFNNGKTAQNYYYTNMYGWDMCLSRKDLVHSTENRMNVYGISEGNDSFICILEEGASYASVKADISGRTSAYNYVQTVYTVKPRERYDLGVSNQNIYVYLEDLPEENLVQRYSFVSGGSYVDMAKDYRNYLLAKYPNEMQLKSDTSVPVAVEMVGAVDKVKQILGVPVSRPLALTTYKEAADLITEIKNNGISNLSVKYTGWCNGGVQQKIFTKAKTIMALGSKKDLAALTAKANEIGVDLYLDGISAYEYQSNIFNGFFSYTDAAKFLSRKRAELYQYSAITYTAREGLDSYFLLHGDKTIDMLKNISSSAAKLNANVSLQDIGSDLASDFYKKKYISRENQLNMQVDVLKNIDNSGQKIMINAGNAYAVPYADVITKMDLRGSEYKIIDECVPFYQIALHGHKNYTGYPINVCGNQKEELLYSAEYGAGLYFTLMKESSFTLQKTLYTSYYGADYDQWKDEMYSIYNRFNSELGHVYSQEITDHKVFSSNVRMTQYADGTKVYVNYGYSNVKINGVTVPARDYLVVK